MPRRTLPRDDDLDADDLRRVHGERALHADSEADLADGERLAVARAVAADDDALEDLDALAAALDDLVADLDGITDAEVRQIVAELLASMARILFMACPCSECPYRCALRARGQV